MNLAVSYLKRRHLIFNLFPTEWVIKNAKCLMNHLTIATSSIFEIWFASGCQHHELAPYINHMEYPWGYALPVSHIISTHESYPQYPWGYAVPVSHILSTRESYPQYLWEYAVPMRICSTHEGSFIHSSFIYGYWGYDSRVLHTLTGTEDMTHGYWMILTGTEDWLKGTDDMTQGYWWYDSRVLRIWLTGTDDMTHG